MPLFEVVILEKPTEKKAKNGDLEKIILAPTPVIASDAQSAGYSVVMDSTDLKINRKRMQVIVRPFT